VGGLEKGMDPPLLKGARILERIPGHIPKMGKSAGEELNWAYRLQDASTNEIYIGMFCKPNHMTMLDLSSWERLQTNTWKDITWYYAPVGYIARTVKKDDTVHPHAYLHQFVLDHCGNGKGGESIDHINQNKLDNRASNLRLASQSLQNTNRGKVARHRDARELPAGIEGPLPKYCVYYKEFLDKERTRWREFFTIEGHPNQKGARKATTKSIKVPILDKLKEANEMLKDLDAALFPLPQPAHEPRGLVAHEAGAL
jgi:hypothetical protein